MEECPASQDQLRTFRKPEVYSTRQVISVLTATELGPIAKSLLFVAIREMS